MYLVTRLPAKRCVLHARSLCQGNTHRVSHKTRCGVVDLLRQNKTQEAIDAFKAAKADKFTASALISHLGKIQTPSVDHTSVCLELYQQFLENGRVPDSALLASLLDTFKRVGKSAEVIDLVWNDLLRFNVAPSSLLLSSLINAITQVSRKYKDGEDKKRFVSFSFLFFP